MLRMRYKNVERTSACALHVHNRHEVTFTIARLRR